MLHIPSNHCGKQILNKDSYTSIYMTGLSAEFKTVNACGPQSVGSIARGSNKPCTVSRSCVNGRR